MTALSRQKYLLEIGYLPEELPPCFNSKDFSKYTGFFNKNWMPLKSPCKLDAYSIPKLGHNRRQLHIVNPVAQFFLSKLIAENWKEINKHFKRNNFAPEKIVINNQGRRSVAPPDFNLITTRSVEISSMYDLILLSDISRFYGTLYTHAIPWALYGKEYSKKNMKTASFISSFGNKLDKSVGLCQERQTLGIPIGPDTSRIISEILAVAIDEELSTRLKKDKTSALRNVDDWTMGFDTIGEAEKAISELSKACKTYELEIHATKTKTVKNSETEPNYWPSEIKNFSFSTTDTGQKASIEKFFTKCFHLSKEHPDHNVLDYSLKSIKSINIKRTSWEIFESYLFKIARINPTTLPTCVFFIVKYSYKKYPLNSKKIEKLISDTLKKNVPLGNHFECSWMLFLAKQMSIRLSADITQILSTFESSICAIQIVDLKKNGLLKGALDLSLWESYINADGLYSNMWLFVYEAGIKNWIKDKGVINADKYFKFLKSKNISFYNSAYKYVDVVAAPDKTEVQNNSDALPTTPVLPLTFTGGIFY